MSKIKKQKSVFHVQIDCDLPTAARKKYVNYVNKAAKKALKKFGVVITTTNNIQIFRVM